MTARNNPTTSAVMPCAGNCTSGRSRYAPAASFPARDADEARDHDDAENDTPHGSPPSRSLPRRAHVLLPSFSRLCGRKTSPAWSL